MKTARSPLTGDSLDLRPTDITAEEATRLRKNVSQQGGFTMPISDYERNLYASRGEEPPK